jgi:DNA excision repair protein ERCC-2
MELSGAFPFERIRPGQREMAKEIAECALNSEHLVAHAPTGIGKTAAAIVPAAIWAAESGGTVFFLTPKHSQHRIAIETLKMLKEKGVKAIASDFIGKKWLCQVTGVAELNGRDFLDYCLSVRRDEICPFYNRTYKKSQPTEEARRAVNSLLDAQPLHVEEAVELTKNFCPYEIMCMAARRANVIVGDYYHIFNPHSATSFLFKTEKTAEGAVLIIDEAHNLPERIRETLSNNISEIGLSKAAKELTDFGSFDLADSVEQIGFGLKKLGKKLGEEQEGLIGKEEFCQMVEGAANSKVPDFSKKLEEAADEIRQKQRKSSAGSLARFLNDWMGPDEGFVRIVKVKRSRSGKPFVILSYQCLDPSVGAKPIIESARSVVLMSGTLVPTKMYAEILGLPEEKTRVRMYNSSFPAENRMNIICTGVTSRYSVRGEAQYRKMAGIASDVVRKTPGSVAIFFPSYGMKELITPFLEIDVPVFDEKQEMKKKEKSDFLKGFHSQKKAVLLAVAGGSLAEGVDFPRNILKGVVVIGLPLQQPNLESRALIDYYQKRFGRGWDYGYLFPAISRAIQAAGRMIRSEKDRGVAVFLDERYSWANYRKCFPPELKTIVTADPVKYVEEFWKE